MEAERMKILSARVQQWGDQVLHPTLQSSARQILGETQLALDGEEIQGFLLMLAGESLRQTLRVVFGTCVKVWHMDPQQVNLRSKELWDRLMTQTANELTDLQPLVDTAHPENN